jgi:hypothetical protein
MQARGEIHLVKALLNYDWTSSLFDIIEVVFYELHPVLRYKIIVTTSGASFTKLTCVFDVSFWNFLLKKHTIL